MKFPSEIASRRGPRSSLHVCAVLACAVLGSLAFGCGGDESGGDDEGGTKPSCAIGVTFSGALDAAFSVGDEVGCAVLDGTDSVDVLFYPGRAVQSIELGIDDIAEGQTGDGFPATLSIVADDATRFSTPASGCSATVTENRLERTEMSSIGERRHRQVVGTGTCSEPAVDAAAAEVIVGPLAFRIPSVWRD